MMALTSYGVLLYKKGNAGIVQYLLGLIPQRTFWTVFKGMPEANDVSPHETALREFYEETGIIRKDLVAVSPDAPVLEGRAGKKRLIIYLVHAPEIQESMFEIGRVVKIDQGYMAGQPEIVAIRWLSLQQAVEGIDGAKIYNSQESILHQAQSILEYSSSSE